MIGILALVLGSAIIAFLVTWQVKHVPSDIGAILKFNFYILFPIWLGNSALGIGFIKGYEVIRNLPAVMALQTFLYYIFLTIGSVYLLGDHIEPVRMFMGFALIVAGIYVLKG